SHDSQKTTIEAEEAGLLRSAQPHRVLGNRVENRLEIRGRAGDHTQDLTRCRLLLQRLGQLTIPLPQLVEQADVLDGDDGLVGEGLEERHLAVGERPDFEATDEDHADRLALAHERDAERGPMSRPHGVIAPQGELRAADGEVVHVNGPPVEDGVGRDPASVPGRWLAPAEGYRPVVSPHAQVLSFPQAEPRVIGLAQPCRAADDRVEDRLHVAERARDHPEDLAGRRLLLERLRLALQRPGPALLELTPPGGFVLQRPAKVSKLSFDLARPELWTLTHRPSFTAR